MKKLLVSVIALFGAVSLSAQDVTAIYNEAAAAFGAKNFTEAATKFEQVIDQGMDNESAASMVATAKSTLPKCYFMLGGDPKAPIVYEVDRIRDGGSFTTRRVVAIQHGRPIFFMTASFIDNDAKPLGVVR